ncbi:MAG TPA: SPFH domain-containing protein, partial [Gemmatimonadales bacterium]|nr:SPFH domain-containing protein [Gemmatimonadales bacterium]
SLVILFLAIGSRFFGSITILEYERAIKFEHGQFVAVVGPGKYRYLSQRTRFHPVDTRLVHEAVSGQEVLSSDAVAFKASLLASYRIVDPFCSFAFCRPSPSAQETPSW